MNNTLIDYIQKEINENRLSHAFLVKTNNINYLLNELIELLTKNNLIEKKNIENNISIKIIEPENNLIDKNKILDLQKFAITKSIVSDYKVYFILNAELMNISASNKLLKVLEEPSDRVIGFLITKKESLIIPTIKSRCTKFTNYYKNKESKELNINLVQKIINIKNASYIDIINIKKELLKHEKMDIISILDACKDTINQEFSHTDSITTLAKHYKILDNIEELIKSNVNIELCLDKLSIEMRK